MHPLYVCVRCLRREDRAGGDKEGSIFYSRVYAVRSDGARSMFASVVCCSTGRAWERAGGDSRSANSASRMGLLRKQVNDSGFHRGIGLADTVGACSVISQWRMRKAARRGLGGGWRGKSLSHTRRIFSFLDIAAAAVACTCTCTEHDRTAANVCTSRMRVFDYA